MYEQRPTVCRIYPAEINPFIELRPEQKECPPEAWSADKPLLMRAQQVVDAGTFALIAKSRAADVSDAGIKARACANLEIDAAALANEGLVIYSPPVALAIAALKRAREQGDESDDTLQWKVVSNRRETVDTLTSIGATGVHYVKADAPAFDYLGFFPASARSAIDVGLLINQAGLNDPVHNQRQVVLACGAAEWLRWNAMERSCSTGNKKVSAPAGRALNILFVKARKAHGGGGSLGASCVAISAASALRNPDKRCW